MKRALVALVAALSVTGCAASSNAPVIDSSGVVTPTDEPTQ